MRIPFVTEKVVDLILRSLLQAGVYGDVVSLDTIRGIDNNSTESELDAVAASLTYGAVATQNFVSSIDDFTVFLNSDASPNPNSANVFRVAEDQTTSPTTLASREIFTVGRNSGAFGNAYATLGPSSSLVGLTDDFPAKIDIGVGGNGSSVSSYGSIAGTATGISVWSSQDVILESLLENVDVGAKKILRLMAQDGINFVEKNSSAIRAGFSDLSSADVQFFLGDLTGNGVAFEKFSGADDWAIRSSDTSAVRTLFITGDRTNPSANDIDFRVGIAGKRGVTLLDPADIEIPNAADSLIAHTATVSIASPNQYAPRCGLYVYHQATSVPNDTHLANFDSEINTDTASDTIRLLSVTARITAGGAHHTVFSVRADRSCDARGGFSTGPADLAEYFKISMEKDNYPPGSVIVIGSTGDYELSSSVGDTKVIGVVSTKPGMGLAYDEAADKNYLLPIAMAGTVPVRVTDSQGAISKGDLLVSSTGGQACKANDSPTIGSILGKALADHSSGAGKIKMLVLNR